MSRNSVLHRPSIVQAGYMLMEMLRPPLPKRGLTALLREPKEKFNPTENE
jgi:hypothetical protein